MSPFSSPMIDIPTENRQASVPDWVRSYLDRIGSVLREGGWDESDVSEMVQLSSSASSGSEINACMINDEAMLDALLLNADRCSDSLQRAGWSSDEISEALCFDFRRERPPMLKLPPGIASKIEKLVQAVSL
ncbi:hypothetical protein HPP92_016110 [Vanilla planifolia]|uniref:Uncharacterized protein n=1 Tax=Vanilla planifolia TaxID=51239 RepID=A0A835UQ63_VANPL|nr:hypothetical protein HPP92_016110 [Vanilla planifolia]